MKRVIALCSILMLLVGCTSETRYGECLGFGDEQNPDFVYETSVRNAILSVLFVETLIVPVVWVVSEAKCPVGLKIDQRHPS